MESMDKKLFTLTKVWNALGLNHTPAQIQTLHNKVRASFIWQNVGQLVASLKASPPWWAL